MTRHPAPVLALWLFACSCESGPSDAEDPTDSGAPDDTGGDSDSADTGGDTDAVDTGGDTDTADTGDSDDTAPPARPPRVFDAALTFGTAQGGWRRYFFGGDDYLRFDTRSGEVGAGYPLAIADGWVGVTAPVDAAALIDANTAVFFAGESVAWFDLPSDEVTRTGTMGDWPGVWPGGVEAAAALDGTLWLFRGPEVLAWDLAAGTAGTAAPIDDVFGVFPEGVDAALADAGALHLFQGDRFATWSPVLGVIDEGRSAFRFPGLWDPHEGTGHPGDALPPSVAALLADDPSAEEIAARKARVAASIVGTSYVDRSGDYPQYLASIEQRLGAWGCLLLHDPGAGVYRFRCATDTGGPKALDVDALTVGWIDWRSAAHHATQTSQGDFLADAGTPLSIFRADDGVFRVHSVTGNGPTGSISAGLNVKVRFVLDGEEHVVGFSHLNTAVPGYVLDAAETGAPLPVGTVFGFVGYTGNLWIGPPPSVDGPYTGTGAGLPDAHTHAWFAEGDLTDDLDNHLGLTRSMREAIDCSSRYPYGGG